jgi:hypothetical protein
MGFNNLKKNNEKFFKEIVENKKIDGKYKNWKNLISRTFSFWDENEITNLENWIDSGLFNSLNKKKEIILEKKNEIISYLKLVKEITENGKLEKKPEKFIPFIDLDNNIIIDENYNFEKKQKNWEKIIENNKREHENLNLNLDFFFRWKKIKNKGKNINSFLDTILETSSEKKIEIYALITRKEEKKNDIIIELQDFRSNFKLKLNKEIYEKDKKIIEWSEIFLNLKIETKNDGYKIYCEKVTTV